MTLTEDGNVGIGTSRPDYKLTVNGTIKARTDVIVEDAGDWGDYVFNDNYKLMPLTELENYIKSNKHLPDIPTASDINTNGLKLAEMNTKMMKKIEELTLYIIKLNKQNQELKLKVSELENKIK